MIDNITAIAQETGQTTAQVNLVLALVVGFIGILPFFALLFWPKIMQWITFFSIRNYVKSIYKRTGKGIIIFSTDVDMRAMNSMEVILRKFEKMGIKEVILILNTLGGYEFAMTRIVQSIKNFNGTVDAYIPRYSMSAGSMIAYACKSIHMSNTSSLGPVDPQMGILFWVHSGKAWQEVVKKKGVKANDESIMMALYAKQYSKLTRKYLNELPSLNGKDKFKTFLSNGEIPHAFQINKTFLKSQGIRVNDMDIPEINDIMEKNPRGLSFYPRKVKA